MSSSITVKMLKEHFEPQGLKFHKPKQKYLSAQGTFETFVIHVFVNGSFTVAHHDHEWKCDHNPKVLKNAINELQVIFETYLATRQKFHDVLDTVLAETSKTGMVLKMKRSKSDNDVERYEFRHGKTVLFHIQQDAGLDDYCVEYGYEYNDAENVDQILELLHESGAYGEPEYPVVFKGKSTIITREDVRVFSPYFFKYGLVSITPKTANIQYYSDDPNMNALLSLNKAEAAYFVLKFRQEFSPEDLLDLTRTSRPDPDSEA